MTVEDDRYFSIETGPEVETRVLASRFLAQAFRVDDESAAVDTIAALRRRYHDATHHGSALRLGEPGAARERTDDDGEPAGTTGAPILAAIVRADRYDTLVVVSRWFGGTKLGTGGLVRAYGDAARAAMDAAPAREIWRESQVVVACDWNDVGAVETILAREGRAVRSCRRDFTGGPRFEVSIVRSRSALLRDALREGTAGRARIES